LPSTMGELPKGGALKGPRRKEKGGNIKSNLWEKEATSTTNQRRVTKGEIFPQGGKRKKKASYCEEAPLWGKKGGAETDGKKKKGG